MVTNDSVSFDQVFLDSAIFKKPLSRAAEDFILDNPVVISQTFFHETKAYMRVLNPESCQILKANIFKITNLIKKGGCRISTLTESFDVCEKALELSRRSKRVCVITENEEMIERLVSEGTADVYDLNIDTLIKRNLYFRYEVFIEPSQGQNITDIKEGSTLSLEGKGSITLSKALNTYGKEGRIYEITNEPKLVAKIYKKHPSPQRCDHLRKLQEIGKRMNAGWCLFPKELLYSADNQLVGFTMDRTYTKMLSDDGLFSGNVECIGPEQLSLRRSYPIDLCLQLLSQVKVLNCYGISVPDFNDGNFSVYCENQPVTMFDTDSFIQGDYFGRTVADDCFSRRYSTRNKNQLSLMCEECALKLVFRILSLGLSPFCHCDKPYIFSSSETPHRYKRSFFSHRVISYFDSVFTDRSNPSVSLLIHELSLAHQELVETSPWKNVTIRQMIEDSSDTPDPYEVTVTPAEDVSSQPESDPIVWQSYSCADAVFKPKRRKKRALPWVLTILALLLGGAVYFLISKGIIF